MKNIAVLFILIFNLLSCMNTKQDNAKSTSVPENFFEGKDLLMAKAIDAANISEIERLIKAEGFNADTRGTI